MTLLQLGELLERERVDRSEQAQLALELADARREGDTVRKRRLLGLLGDVRLGVEVAAQHLDRGLEPQAGLGLVDLSAPHAPRTSSSRRSVCARSLRCASSRAVTAPTRSLC